MTIPQADASTTGRRHLRARILAKNEVAPRHFAITLANSEIARNARAGQFVHILPHPRTDEDENSWTFDPLLRRAFSIMDAKEDTFEVLFRVEGKGTRLLSHAQVGEFLDIIGPLGNGFSLTQATKNAILVGGGVGVPPMVFVERILQAHGINTQMLLGARSAADVLCEGRFTSLQIATDDGSRGYHGRVGDLLEQSLESALPDVVFACGPYPMLRAIALICETRGVACEVSLEENMPCGIGVCNGCVVPMRSSEQELEGDDYGRYRRICVHGPACNALDIDWK